jgi:hypothetical protein
MVIPLKFKSWCVLWIWVVCDLYVHHFAFKFALIFFVSIAYGLHLEFTIINSS